MQKGRRPRQEKTRDTCPEDTKNLGDPTAQKKFDKKRSKLGVNNTPSRQIAKQLKKARKKEGELGVGLGGKKRG